MKMHLILRCCKTIFYAIGSSLLVITPLLSLLDPDISYASESGGLGWSPQEFINDPNTGLADEGNPDTAFQAVSTFVNTASTAVAGFAIIFFVLRVALTAIDRMVLENGSSSANKTNPSPLVSIPFIGAYPYSYEWKHIWLTFFKQFAIIAAAWSIVQLLMGVLLLFFGKMQ